MVFSDIENITKGIGVITAALALLGSGATAYSKFWPNDILEWAPEYFELSDGKPSDEFHIVVAREKKRDDCKVENFHLEVKDASYHVWPAQPSITTFSGPANDKVDKFAYMFTIDPNIQTMVTPGTATLLGEIEYTCPEGPVIVAYPSNLTFEILEPDTSNMLASDDTNHDLHM